MNDCTERKTTPRILVEQVIARLEQRYGSQTAEECLRLAQASVLLQKAEACLFADPVREWPRVGAGNTVLDLFRSIRGHWGRHRDAAA